MGLCPLCGQMPSPHLSSVRRSCDGSQRGVQALFLGAGALILLTCGTEAIHWTPSRHVHGLSAFLAPSLSKDRPWFCGGASHSCRTRGIIDMKVNRRKAAEMERLAKLEAEGRQRQKTGKKTKGETHGDDTESAPKPLVSRHRVVILKPTKASGTEGQVTSTVDDSAMWQPVLAQEMTSTGGFSVERVRVVEHASVAQYGEAKAMAYLQQGLRIANNTMLIAQGDAAGDVLRFLEKRQARGAILIDPPALYRNGPRAWDVIRENAVFYGVLRTRTSDCSAEEAEAVREGLGIQPYLVRTVAGQATEHEVAAAVNGLIKDWQFLESFSLQPIELFE